MDGVAGGRARRDDAADEPLRARRPRSELLYRLSVDAGPLRPPVGAGARRVRHGALHELREYAAQAENEGVHAPVRVRPGATDALQRLSSRPARIAWNSPSRRATCPFTITQSTPSAI